MADPVTGRLENWEYDPIYYCMLGELYDDIHHRWEPGHYIHTSRLATTGPFAKGQIVQTKNSSYLLGDPA